MKADMIGELISFGFSIVTGLGLGILFDMYRSFRSVTKPGKFMSGLEDLLFWVISIAAVFILLVKTTDGILRGFIFIGCICGFLIYMIIFSKYVFYIFNLFFMLIIGMIGEIIKLVLNPFRGIHKNIRKMAKKIIYISKRFIEQLGKYKKMRVKKK